MHRKVFFALAVCLLSFPLVADTLVVPLAYPTLQEAIDAAADGDTVLVTPGTYSGSGFINVDFRGKAITVRSTLGATLSTIDCQGQGRAFIFRTGETAASVLEGFTIINGLADTALDPKMGDFGGAIECDGASPTIRACVFRDNQAEYGGAIDSYYAAPTIVDCVFMGNLGLKTRNGQQTGQGGAIECVGTATGGISPVITNCLFVNNFSAQYGSAINVLEASAPSITNCTFVQNTVGHDETGAAVYADVTSPLASVVNGILWDNGTHDVIGGMVSYSCVQDGTAGPGNIAQDPLFKRGPLGDYYLSNEEAGQAWTGTSPCVDSGNPDMELGVIGLDTYTTRTDNVYDAEPVDMGYHYRGGAAPVMVDLTAEVLPDVNDVVQGTITPEETTVARFTEVILTVSPDFPHRVEQWNGTNEDTSTSNTNYVTMDQDRHVTVELRKWPTAMLTTEIVEGTGVITPATGPQILGDRVLVEVQPDAGWMVDRWEGTDDDELYSEAMSTVAWVTMDGDRTVRVTLASSTVAQLRCIVMAGDGSVIPYRRTVPVGTVVDLEARPDPGWRLRRWVGTDQDELFPGVYNTDLFNTVTMNRSKTVMVEFELAPVYWLETVVYSPDGIPHGTLEPESGWVEEDTIVDLVATPDEGYEVELWYGSDDDTLLTPTNTATMSDDRRVVVRFREIVEEPPLEGQIWLNEDRGAFFGTIQEAVDAAVDGDVVNVSFGIYAGDGNRDIELLGKAITVQGVFGPEETIIDCGGAARGFWIRANESANTVIRGFTIMNGSAARGAGIYFMADAQAVVEDCIIMGCRAGEVGGGVCFAGADVIEAVDPSGDDPNDPDYDPGDPGVENNEDLFPRARLANVRIQNCSSGGAGGAIYIEEAAPVIVSCELSFNNANGTGGGIYVLGVDDQTAFPAIINCLINSNRAGGVGGAIYIEEAAPTIRLCTIVNNMGATDPDAPMLGPAGGIVNVSEELAPTINHCILDGNGDDLRNCSASYSCVTDLDTDSAGPGNVYDDPQFIPGPQGIYYLGQRLGNQPRQSPCVDAGQFILGQLQGQYGLAADITTAVTQVPDIDRTDMGYHYPIVIPDYGPDMYKFKLYPAGNGITHYRTQNNADPLNPYEGDVVSDGLPAVLYLPFWTVVRLRAVADTGYRIDRWQGTDNDQARGPGNQVTMTTDREVHVTFVEYIPRVLLVPDVYPTIEQAVAAAYGGDTIIVRPGVHYVQSSEGIDFGGKSLRLLSTRPDDPATIAATIIDCQGARLAPRRAFHFHNGEVEDAVIAGFTVRNGWMNGGVGTFAPRYIWPPLPPVGPNFEPPDTVFSAVSGGDAVGDGYGGAILCENASSPTIQYCVFVQNTVTGAQGNDGVDGNMDMLGPALFRQNAWHSMPGGHGGTGTGNGYGGAIACLDGSSPLIGYCTFTKNTAHGGCGGNGGDAGSLQPLADAGLPIGHASRGGDGGDAYGAGKGGAIYADLDSGPVVLNCEFIVDVATDGIVGLGGERSDIGNEWPDYPSRPGAQGTASTMGEQICGGAAYYEGYSRAIYENCRFIGNKAFQVDRSYSTLWPYWDTPPTDEIYALGGAIYIAPNNTVDLQDCTFEENLGGAIYFEGADEISLQRCVFRRNGTRFFLGIPYMRYWSDYMDYNHYAQTYSQSYDSPPGAVYIGDRCSSVDLVDCDFGENFTFGDGGAVSVLSTATFEGCTFGGNRSEVSGGAVFSDARQLFAGSAIPQLTFERCTFRENEANEGGAVYFHTTQGTFEDCHILANTAHNGGGLSLADTWVDIRGGSISGNVASSYDAQGGGIAAFGTTLSLADCALQGNRAEGKESFGGALCAFGGDGQMVHQQVTNCLFTGNTSEAFGGAVAARMRTEIELTNCTFAANTAGRAGGGVFGDWAAFPVLTNCILVGNAPYAVYEEPIGYAPLPRGDSTLTYSLFFDNDADLFDSATRRAYTGADALNAIGGNRDNLDDDPLLVAGPLGRYYLDVASPAVDTGSMTAQEAGLHTRTTRPDNMLDAGVVDRGYHYRSVEGAELLTLTASVVGGHGTVAPVAGTYYPGQVVYLTATPDAGYRVDHWGGGTVNDAADSLTNVVVMDSDKHVTVQFKQPRVLVVGSTPRYTSIQRTIDEAEDGDIVMINPGLYQPPHSFDAVTFMGKDITLTGANPDDPAVVEATVLTDYDLLVVGVGKKGAIEGITFEASTITVSHSELTIRNCNFRDGQWFGADGDDGDGDGYNGTSVYGGAITMYFSSPQVLNCHFENISLTGGNGGRGADGPDGFDGGWGGRAYGGAVYMGFLSNPVFDGCEFVDCFVQGGRGGDGGNATAPDGYGGRGGSWQWADTIEYEWFYWWDGWQRGTRFYNPYVLVYPGLTGPSVSVSMINMYPWERFSKWFGLEDYLGWDDWIARGGYDRNLKAYDDYWRYTGLGGAVYCELDSNPTFIDCHFENCRSYSGISGIGGDGVQLPTRWPERNLLLENAGGAIFATRGCKVTMVDSTLQANLADPSTVIDLDGPDGEDPIDLYDDYYVGFGGAIAYTDDCRLHVTNSTFRDNQAAVGGALYWDRSHMDVVDCNVLGNSAYHGGGLYAAYSTGSVEHSFVWKNVANAPVVLGDDDPDVGQPTTVPLPHDIRSGKGGGFYSLASRVEVRDSTFEENRAVGSGGGIYYAGADDDVSYTQRLTNSLLNNNAAVRDGGGVSANWYARLWVENCTIADNQVSGSGSEGSGVGGGLYASYFSHVDVINSILWDNVALDGAQIAVASGDPYGPKPSIVNVTYTDVGPIPDPNAVYGLPEIVPDIPMPPAGTGVVIDAATIQQQYAEGAAFADVIVTLRQPVELRKTMKWDVPASVEVYRNEVSRRIDGVLSTLAPAQYTLKYRYENIAAFSASVTPTALNQLAANSMVMSIEPVRYVHWMLRQSIALANAIQARQVYDGTGVAIAIIDSGVDYRHPMLGGGTFPNDKVIGGYDTAMDDPDPLPVGEAHGTCCAGIAAGTLGEVGDYIGGVAYNAKLYALKISDDDGAISTAGALAAWDWCITHQYDDPENPILVMSNSWGAVGLPFDDATVADTFAPAFTQTAALALERGITILAASGNDGFAGQGISWPSAMSDVVSVGAVYDTTDQVTEYSNTAAILDILAPADPMYTTDIIGVEGYDPGDYFPYFNGTSSACPFAAGSVAVVQRAAQQQIGRYLTPTEVRDVLIKTGAPVTDTKVPITKPRVNLGAAVGGMAPTPPIYIEDQCLVPGWDPNSMTWAQETYNFAADPLFVGPYFLSEIVSGQLEDSPCLNVGSDLAEAVGLGEYTTRTDSVFDDGVVNLGFHYRPFEPEFYRLRTNVNAYGLDLLYGYEPQIIPHDPNGLWVRQYSQFALRIEPPPPFGYDVVWTGTDDDTVTAPENVVTVDRDRAVLAEFAKTAFELITAVDVDPNILPDFEPTITPPSGLFMPLEVVEVRVTPPPPGFQVRWRGTDNDGIVEPVNTVTMLRDTKVWAIYEPVEVKYFAVIVGINEYPGVANDLQYAVRDASQVHQKLAATSLWDPRNMRLLLDAQATKANVQYVIESLIPLMDHDDVFLFYFAGHGYADEDVAPIDEFDGFDEYLAMADGVDDIRDDELARWILSLPTRNYVVFLDAGFHGASQPTYFRPRGLGVNVPKPGDGFAADMVAHTAILPDGTTFVSDPNGLGVAVSGADASEVAWETAYLEHGVFTYHLLKAIEGAADWEGNADLWISAEECFAYTAAAQRSLLQTWEDLGELPIEVEQQVRLYDGRPQVDQNFATAPPVDGPRQIFYVPADVDNLQEAIELARPGDTIILAADTYEGGRIIIDKPITITSTNPDDPAVVASTIINCQGYHEGCIFFTNNAGRDTVLNGVTLQNGDWTPTPPDPGVFDGRHIAGGGIVVGYKAAPTIKNCLIRGFTLTGGNAVGGSLPDGADGGFALGAGVFISSESSPRLVNCVITDCHVIGGNATDGVDATAGDPGANPPVPRQDTAGRGGWGGGARGGGVYIGPGATPVFEHCIISNCSATGGNGGDGGDYATVDGIDVPGGYGGLWSSDDVAPWQAWGYFADYPYYSGMGGGVYCEQESAPTFIGCEIYGNSTRGGVSGQGGLMPTGYNRKQPLIAYELPSFGGGVYCGADAEARFVKCKIYDNVAPKPTTNYTLSFELGHGGGVAFEDTAAITFENCLLARNEASVGGGLYWRQDDPVIVDCNLLDNRAYKGGGLCAKGGAGTIIGGLIRGNLAHPLNILPGGGTVDPNAPGGGGTGTTAGEVPTDFVWQGGGACLIGSSIEMRHTQILRNHSGASGGGVFMTGQNQSTPRLLNVLIAENRASRDGGGVSVNWLAEPYLFNCTIAENEVLGNYGSYDGGGGGLYAGYHSYVHVLDSIFWNNTAALGRQILVGTGFEYDPRPSTLSIASTIVQGGEAPDALLREPGCTVDSEGVMADNPLFVVGPQGAYYLSQSAANDPTDPWADNQVDSPAVDAGSVPASERGLDRRTTRTDRGLNPDRGMVDLGYHYPLSTEVDECQYCDLVFDGLVGLEDLLVIADAWLSMDCAAGTGWCGGADINTDTAVDLLDYLAFAACWLVEDVMAPLPNPAEWGTREANEDGRPAPVPGSTSRIIMTARKGWDAWGWPVAYQFECVEINGVEGHYQKSPWIYFPVREDVYPTWIDTGLTDLTRYTYVVRVGEVKSLGKIGDGNTEVNLTDADIRLRTFDSEPIEAIAGWENDPPVPVVNDPATPDPDPVRWATVALDGVDGLPTPTAVPTELRMIAALCTDVHGPVEYRFIRYADMNTDIALFESPWQLSNTFVDTGLVTGTTYYYVFRARDQLGNVTESPRVAGTPATVDLNPPLPNPAEWDPANAPLRTQDRMGNYVDYMVAAQAQDPEGTLVEYRFVCEDSASLSSPWRSQQWIDHNGDVREPWEYIVQVSRFGDHFWHVVYRDTSPNLNQTQPSTTIRTQGQN